MEVLKESPGRPPIALRLDNDRAGRACLEILSRELRALQVRHMTANISGLCKDPNEALVHERAKFSARLDAAAMQLAQIASSVPAKDQESGAAAQFMERARQAPMALRDPDRFTAFLRFMAANLQMDAANALGVFLQRLFCIFRTVCKEHWEHDVKDTLIFNDLVRCFLLVASPYSVHVHLVSHQGHSHLLPGRFFVLILLEVNVPKRGT